LTNLCSEPAAPRGLPRWIFHYLGVMRDRALQLSQCDTINCLTPDTGPEVASGKMKHLLNRALNRAPFANRSSGYGRNGTLIAPRLCGVQRIEGH
jgi:hypothetical protein